jgi:hypothetical protein
VSFFKCGCSEIPVAERGIRLEEKERFDNEDKEDQCKENTDNLQITLYVSLILSDFDFDFQIKLYYFRRLKYKIGNMVN